MDINYKVTNNAIHTIRPNNPDFVISDGFRTSPRAGFEFDRQCPDQYRKIILDAINRGWLMPIAYVHDTELVWGKLQR